MAGIGQAPQPDTLAIFRPAEVIPVLWPSQPLPLAGRLRGPLAIRLRAVLLTPVIAVVTAILFVAMQALGFGLRTHLRTQNNPPAPHLHAPAQRRKPAPFTPEEDAEEDEGRRVLLEALEEDAPLTPCAFQTAQIMRSSNRRPQSLARRADSHAFADTKQRTR